MGPYGHRKKLYILDLYKRYLPKKVREENGLKKIHSTNSPLWLSVKTQMNKYFVPMKSIKIIY